MRHIGRYLQSTRNLAGSALGLGGLVLHAFGLAGRYWLPVVIGLYLVGALLAPSGRARGGAALSGVDGAAPGAGGLTGGGGRPGAGGPGDVDLRVELERLRRGLRRAEIPAQARVRLRAIAVVVDGLLDRPEELAARPESWFAVDNAVRADLRASFEAYLALPRWYAGRRRLPGAGRSAEAELLAQLESIERVLTRAAEDVYGGHARWMVEHGRRLAERAGDDST